MPYCAVLQCRNDIRNMNLANMGISYYRFPNPVHLKEKWVNATGRQNWLPTKASTICSLHFKDEDYLPYGGTCGNKLLNRTAVPSLNILCFKKQEDTIFEHILLNQTEEEQECKHELNSDSDTTEVLKSTTLSATSIINPRQIRIMENRIKKQQLVIFKLKNRNHRMAKKIEMYEDIISACIRKKNL